MPAALWSEGEASGTGLLINSANWLGESGGRCSLQAPCISLHLLYSLRRDLISLRAVRETEAQVLWQKEAELALETSSKSVSSLNKSSRVTGCGLGPLERDSSFPGVPAPLPRLSLLLLQSPDSSLLLWPCQGPALYPSGPALACTVALHIPLPGGLSASHQVEGSDCTLLGVGASVPGTWKMLSKFLIS